jgi:vitamin-K-epoxide reductase (warfarin-sensitive)
VQPAVSGAADRLGENSTNSSQRNRTLFLVVAILALAGMAVSAVSLQRHYAKSASQFCDFGERFNCDVVNRSEYSSIVGIPVAGIGVAGYAVLFALAAFYRSRVETPLRLLLAAGAGFVFALYLTYVEGFVLETWCILCLSSLTLIAMITALAVVVKMRSRPGE